MLTGQKTRRELSKKKKGMERKKDKIKEQPERARVSFPSG